MGEMGVCLDTGHANLSADIYSVMHKLGRHLHGPRFCRDYLHMMHRMRLANAAHFCQIVDQLTRRRIPIGSILVDGKATLGWLYTPLSHKLAYRYENGNRAGWFWSS